MNKTEYYRGLSDEAKAAVDNWIMKNERIGGRYSDQGPMAEALARKMDDVNPVLKKQIESLRELHAKKYLGETEFKETLDSDLKDFRESPGRVILEEQMSVPRLHFNRGGAPDLGAPGHGVPLFKGTSEPPERQ